MEKTKINPEILAFLDSGGIETINIRGFIENSNPDIITNEEMTGVWINDGYFNFLYSNDDNFITKVLNQLKEQAFVGFSGTSKYVRDFIFKSEIFHWENPCKLFTLCNPSFSHRDIKIEVDSLTESDAKIVDDNYEFKHDESINEIKDAINTRPTSCVRIDGVLASYAALHQDNSIGYMYTLEEYRNKNYAYEVSRDLILKTIASNRIPYVHIIEWNKSSLKLADKVGLKFAKDVSMFGIINPSSKDFDGDKKKFYEVFNKVPTHITTKLELASNFKNLVLEVKRTDKQIIISDSNKSYKIKYSKSDECYLFDVALKIPNNVLRSALLEFLDTDDYLVMINLENSVNANGFTKIK